MMRKLFSIIIFNMPFFHSMLFAYEGISPLTINVMERNEIAIIIDPQTHIDYGLAYPATYEFTIPIESVNLKSFRKFKSIQNWTQIIEKTNDDFYNGIEAVRFNYEIGIAYVSIGFSELSDTIFIKITDNVDNNIVITYSGISQYYDDRDAVVTSTADDWASWCNEKFIQTCQIFRSYNLWLSCAVVTSGVDDNTWLDIQNQLNLGFVEVVSHSRTHPYVPYENLEGEVLGSKQDLIENLELPQHNRYGIREYIYAWVAPYGEYDEDIDVMVSVGKYLVSRLYYGDVHVFSNWNQFLYKFNPVGVSTEFGPLWLGTIDTILLNNTFDEVVLNGGIYHVMCHPNILEWDEEYPWAHLDHISNRKNIWYVGFGHMYSYRFLQSVYPNLNVGDHNYIPDTNEMLIDQNYPNPFNSKTAINYTLNRDSMIDITVYDISGRKVKTLLNKWQIKGDYKIKWDANGQKGEDLPSGMYFYQLKTENFVKNKRMILLK